MDIYYTRIAIDFETDTLYIPIFVRANDYEEAADIIQKKLASYPHCYGGTNNPETGLSLMPYDEEYEGLTYTPEHGGEVLATVQINEPVQKLDIDNPSGLISTLLSLDFTM